MFDRLFKMHLRSIKRRGERQKIKQELKARYAEYYPSKKRKVSNTLLAIIVVAIIAYTIANFWLTYATGVTMDSTLTTCFYAFWGSELALMAGIRVSKVVKSSDCDNLLDRSIDEDDESMG